MSTRQTSEATTEPMRSEILHRPSGTGRTFWGPGDLYTFLVTRAESGGSYFTMEALVPPGGGPPPHIHRNEDETFYVVEDARLDAGWKRPAHQEHLRRVVELDALQDRGCPRCGSRYRCERRRRESAEGRGLPGRRPSARGTDAAPQTVA